MNPQDNPQFTAYALGELSAEEAGIFHDMLAASPAAVHELEQIEAVTDALRHGAPIPQSRLTHEQRHAVLHPSNMPRRMQPMLPRKPVARPRALFWPVMGAVLKTAAVVGLTGAAFFAGWSLSPVTTRVTEASEPENSIPPVKTVEVKTLPTADEMVLVRTEVEQTPTVIPEKPKVAVTQPATTKPAAVSPKSEIVVVKATPPSEPGSPAMGFSMLEGRGVFATTTKQVADTYALRPSLIKPVPPKAKGAMFASPQISKEPARAEPKPTRPSTLYIHSWQAEVASCPWNPAHRLLRIVIQLPADQPAVISSQADFPLQVAFDVANVKQYRMLGERHLQAAELRSAGTHVLWYEFQPNGSEASGDSGRQIATVTLADAHFTTQTVGPFDSSRLQVIDRGYSLQNAREDFVFETSVVGFGLLMRGAEQVGSLNHSLVLNLARQGKGSDARGERARFIRLVQDAQRFAGL